MSDEQLLSLGRQFDAAVAEAKKLTPEKKRLHAAYQRIASERGIPGDDIKERHTVMAECGYLHAARAHDAPASESVRIMKAIHLLHPTTIEGIAVKLRAICFDFADFNVENMSLKNGDVAEVQLGRLMKHVQKLAKGAVV